MQKLLEKFQKADIVRDMCEKMLADGGSSDERRVMMELYDLPDASLETFYDALQYAIKQSKKQRNFLK